MARLPCAISPSQHGGTSMSRKSTRVKAVLAAVGLLIATASAATASASASAATQGGTSTYIVLYNDGASSANAAATVASAGGTLVANYTQIGVVIARSSDPNFAAAVQQNGNVAGAASTAGFATQLNDVADDSGPIDPPVPAPGG